MAKPLNPKKKSLGFTLVELLAVIAILGILATIALVASRGSSSRARDARRVSDLRTIQAAIELYIKDSNAKLPPGVAYTGNLIPYAWREYDDGGLWPCWPEVIDDGSPAVACEGFLETDLSSYLDTNHLPLPLDPIQGDPIAEGSQFHYLYCAKHNGYIMAAMLENSQNIPNDYDFTAADLSGIFNQANCITSGLAVPLNLDCRDNADGAMGAENGTVFCVGFMPQEVLDGLN